MNMNEIINSIPVGTTDYYGKNANLRNYVLSIIEKIYKKYGFENLNTPIIENAEVFKGHHGEGEKLLFKLKDKNNNNLVLKYDSTVPLARVISMHDDIKLPYKRYQMQPSFRDDEIDKGHFREFIQCDGDIVGSNSLVSDSEFVCISHDALKQMGFEDFTIRLNHRKLIQAIAEKENITSREGILEIQRAIDLADKINKGSIKEIKKEMLKANLKENIVDTIIEIINISKNYSNILTSLEKLEEYFGNNENAKEGIKDLKEIISLLPEAVLKNVKIDFTLARGADYYTGFIIEAVINNLKIGAVLGGGRYDDLVAAFSNKKVPAVGLAFGMERLIIAMKELGLDKKSYDEEGKILLYADPSQKNNAVKVANKLRSKYNVSLVFNNELNYDQVKDYCISGGFSLIASLNKDGGYNFYSINELDNLNVKKLILNK